MLREIRDSKGMGVGVAAEYNGHGYYCYQVDCLEREPFVGTTSKYIFKQGKWFEIKGNGQLTETKDAKLIRDLTAVNEKVRPLISSLIANKEQQARLVQ